MQERAFRVSQATDMRIPGLTGKPMDGVAVAKIPITTDPQAA